MATVIFHGDHRAPASEGLFGFGQEVLKLSRGELELLDVVGMADRQVEPVSYTHLTLPTTPDV